ncbi:multdrug transfer [Coniochaeta sp. 2T2.1]|nr:multdrug transfer [Coniochaeta sp. 2T2.1]
MDSLSAFLRDTPLGQGLRWATNKQVLKFPEERPGFKLPSPYHNGADIHDTVGETLSRSTSDREQDEERENSAVGPSGDDLQSRLPPDIETGLSFPASACILVDWYGDDDAENPHSWPTWKKAYVHLSINIYTFAIYMSSSIYTPAAPALMEIYGISHMVASLGLGLYVLGYAIGPLVFGPPSEIASVGRNPVYVITMFLFVLLSVPAALSDNMPGFMILRFLQGFFGSPGLANGGGSIGDITTTRVLPYALYLWAFFPLAGPSVGPMIAGFSVTAKNWRWAMWEIVWIAGLSFVNLLLLPETSSSNILYRRAGRLRALTGNPAYSSRSQISQRHLSAARIARMSLLVPWKINALDPSVLFTSLYCGLVYAIFYSFFEVFPLVYMDIYGMNYGEMGAVFMSVLIAVLVVGVPYMAFIHYVVNKAVREGRQLQPEVRLIPGVVASFLVPAGLFLFAWTARSDIHWVVPSLGVLLASGGVCIIIQSVYVYLAMAYPQYAASLIGANTFCRGAMALAAILWSGPLYSKLGIARGTSLLGGLCGGCIIGMFVLWLRGAELRKRSRFAVDDVGS